jgi:hypothetical protein
MKTSLNGVNNRLDTTKNEISEIEDCNTNDPNCTKKEGKTKPLL